MHKILVATAALSMLWLSAAAAQSGKTPAKAPAKKTTTTVRRRPATTSARKGTTTSSSRAKKPAARKPAVTWRNRQVAPSQERYREIQSALVSRGYLSPDDATGTWNQASIDALKRFQAEQKLDASGKINSLSLIALGLGPKREAAPVTPPKPQADHQMGQLM